MLFVSPLYRCFDGYYFQCIVAFIFCQCLLPVGYLPFTVSASAKWPQKMLAIPIALMQHLQTLQACWMACFRVRFPQKLLWGPLPPTSNHRTDQWSLNRASTNQQMGAKTKLCRLHFALLSCIVWKRQSPHAVVRINNDGSTKSLWVTISLLSADWRNYCELSSVSYMMVVTFASWEKISFLFF